MPRRAAVALLGEFSVERPSSGAADMSSAVRAWAGSRASAAEQCGLAWLLALSEPLCPHLYGGSSAWQRTFSINAGYNSFCGSH